VITDSGYEAAQAAYELEREQGIKIYYPPRKHPLRGSVPWRRSSKKRRLRRRITKLMRARVDSPRGQELLRRRAIFAEGAFALIKVVLGFERFLLRGIQKVQTEWTLVCLAANLRKITAAS
jgi:Transposase DDE domain